MYCVDSIFRNGETIHYINCEREASIVILLHGFPDNGFGWDLQIEYLKEKFHVIAPFMPGTLNGNLVSDERLKSSELQLDILEIISQIRKNNSRNIYILGHDLGCFLGNSVVSELNNEVKGLIHINGLGLEQFVSRKMSLSQWLKSSYALLFQFQIIRRLVTGAFGKFILKKAYEKSLVPRNDDILRNDKRVLRSIVLYKHLFQAAVRLVGKRVKKISVPTLLIWGRDDAFLNTPSINEVERFYVQGSVRILDGGHWVTRSHPEQVNRIICKTLGMWEESL